MKRKMIKCVECKRLKDCAKFDNRQLKDGSIRYQVRCITCKRDRKQLIKDVQLASKYSITYAELATIREKSNNACQICHKTDSRLVIDHCHTTGIVRGLLCHYCNTRLGTLETLLAQGLLISSLDYLETSYNSIIKQLST